MGRHHIPGEVTEGRIAGDARLQTRGLLDQAGDVTWSLILKII